MKLKKLIILGKKETKTELVIFQVKLFHSDWRSDRFQMDLSKSKLYDAVIPLNKLYILGSIKLGIGVALVEVTLFC